MSFFDGTKPTFKNVQQYSAVFVAGKDKPIAMFQTDTLARTFISLMTDGEQDYSVKPFRFVAEKESK